MTGVLGVSPREFVGASRVLLELSRIGLSDFVYLDELKLPIEGYEVVVFAAWHPTYNILLPQIKARKWIVHTSPLLQSELAEVEVDYLLYIMRNDQIEKVWFGDPETAQLFPEKGFWLPYPMETERLQKFKTHGEKRDIGLLTALHNKQKNIMNQLSACRLVQRENPDVRLHLNGLTPRLKRFCDAIRLNYIDHGWLKEEDYYRLVSSLKLQTHVFLSESFSYSTFESMILGTPVIVSPTIAKNLSIKNEWLVVKNVDDPFEIAGCLTLEGTPYSNVCKEVEQVALEVAERNNSEVKRFFLEPRKID